MKYEEKGKGLVGTESQEERAGGEKMNGSVPKTPKFSLFFYKYYFKFIGT
jgi:hypothetical protein